jgi:hypothetical protein
MQWKPSVDALSEVHWPEAQPFHCSHSPLVHWALLVHQHGVAAPHVVVAPPASHAPTAHAYVFTPVAPEVGASWQSAASKVPAVVVPEHVLPAGHCPLAFEQWPLPQSESAVQRHTPAFAAGAGVSVVLQYADAEVLDTMGAQLAVSRPVAAPLQLVALPQPVLLAFVPVVT